MSAHYVYRCYDETNRLLYVGATKNVFARVEAHRAKSWWAPTVARVAAEAHPSKVAALAVEREAIASELPRWNTRGKWASRAQWSEQDYLDYIRAYQGSAGSMWVRDHLERVRRDMVLLFGGAAA